MKYMDIVNMPDIDANLVSRLGYSKVLRLGTDMVRATGQRDLDSKMSAIPSSSPMLHLLSRPNAAAALLDGSSIDKRSLDIIRDAGKPLVIGLSQLTSLRQKERVLQLQKLRTLYTNAKHQGVKVQFATLAADPSQLMSRMQLMCAAKLIGASDEEAKAAMLAKGENR